MKNFFAPPAEQPRLAEDKIDAEYRRMRLKVFLGAFFGYAAYYLVRHIVADTKINRFIFA